MRSTRSQCSSALSHSAPKSNTPTSSPLSPVDIQPSTSYFRPSYPLIPPGRVLDPVILKQAPLDKGGPRRPMNPFMIFGRWRRLGLRDRKLNTQQLSGILSHEWKSMNEETRLFWYEQGAILQMEFKAANPNYVYTRGPKGSRNKRSRGSQGASSQKQPSGVSALDVKPTPAEASIAPAAPPPISSSVLPSPSLLCGSPNIVQRDSTHSALSLFPLDHAGEGDGRSSISTFDRFSSSASSTRSTSSASSPLLHQFTTSTSLSEPHASHLSWSTSPPRPFVHCLSVHHPHSDVHDSVSAGPSPSTFIWVPRQSAGERLLLSPPAMYLSQFDGPTRQDQVYIHSQPPPFLSPYDDCPGFSSSANAFSTTSFPASSSAIYSTFPSSSSAASSSALLPPPLSACSSSSSSSSWVCPALPATPSYPPYAQHVSPSCPSYLPATLLETWPTMEQDPARAATGFCPWEEERQQEPSRLFATQHQEDLHGAGKQQQQEGLNHLVGEAGELQTWAELMEMSQGWIWEEISAESHGLHLPPRWL